MENMKNPRVLIRVSEAARMLSVGRSKAYSMVQAGELPSVRIGSALRIPVDALNAWLNSLTAEGTAEACDTEARFAAVPRFRT